eukprot:c27028_g1_i1.p1 GENE.c27028_g1_i1~~c27028_g1_i1.p1  ORF type:complete len:216 (-),score=34.46 c27028_g1_i1:4-600(-)
MTTLRAKVVLVGDAGSGKTALSQVLHSGAGLFPKNYTMTFEAHVPDVPKSVVVQESVEDKSGAGGAGAISVDLLVYDVPGQPFLLDQAVQTCAGASMLALVFDVTNRASFEALSGWMDSIRDVMRPDVPGIIIGNKADLSMRRQVPAEEGVEFGQAIGYRYFETAATDADSVEVPFTHLAQAFYSKYRTFVASRSTLA